jgi:hypothetical protein
MADAAPVGQHSVDEVIGRHNQNLADAAKPSKRKIHFGAEETKGTLVLGAETMV